MNCVRQPQPIMLFWSPKNAILPLKTPIIGDNMLDIQVVSIGDSLPMKKKSKKQKSRKNLVLMLKKSVFKNSEAG